MITSTIDSDDNICSIAILFEYFPNVLSVNIFEIPVTQSKAIIHIVL